MDIAQTQFNSSNTTVYWNSQGQALPVTQIFFGLRSGCIHDAQDHLTCLKTVNITTENTLTENTTDPIVLQVSWDPLYVHAAPIGLTLFTSLTTYMDIKIGYARHHEDWYRLHTIKTSLALSFFVVLSTLAAGGVDVVHFLKVKNGMASLLLGGVSTSVGLGVWLTLFSLFLGLVLILLRYIIWVSMPWPDWYCPKNKLPSARVPEEGATETAVATDPAIEMATINATKTAIAGPSQVHPGPGNRSLMETINAMEEPIAGPSRFTA